MSDPTGQQRPRPQYGEYATPEEQRARIRQPDPAFAVTPETVPAAAAPASVPPTAPAGRASAVKAMSGPRLADRIITFGLLGYGLFTVLGSIPAATDYAQFASTFLGVFGVDQELADPAGARGWGLAAALVLGIGWVATFGLSWMSVRARRISFWIPLVGGIVFNMVSSVLLVVPLMSDPAVWSALQDALTAQVG
ncbi:hypothetical protein F6J84_05275 [Microbacterium caowuchunii]|uniref:DUF6264 family protein n=1 Tax=Microbacterium caowuchunii TaxID=2614638 RepID=UPI00124882EE|nr:DUF6264 family protein [Microbacterium caowuchunii]QEV99567.1 hypothetical protein F6J84_05275 [Microbacterium caowuchunii]